jgi:hypothetical protein
MLVRGKECFDFGAKLRTSLARVVEKRGALFDGLLHCLGEQLLDPPV